MSDQSTILETVSDWWRFAFVVVGAILAFVLGRERQRYKVDQIGKEVCFLKEEMKEIRKELSSMHTQEGADAVEATRSITELSVDIKYLRKTIDEIRLELKQKADK